MYKIQFSADAKRFLKKLKNKELKDRILKSIFLLQINPFPKSNFKFIEPEKEKIRIRIGKYRVLYKIIENELIILIITIDKRSRVYRK